MAAVAQTQAETTQGRGGVAGERGRSESKRSQSKKPTRTPGGEGGRPGEQTCSTWVPTHVRVQDAARDQLEWRTKETFNAFDRNGDGSIQLSELGAMLEAMHMRSDPESAAKEMAAADADGDGEVSYDEFVNYYNSLIRRGDLDRPGALDEALASVLKEAEGGAVAEKPAPERHFDVLADAAIRTPQFWAGGARPCDVCVRVCVRCACACV